MFSRAIVRLIVQGVGRVGENSRAHVSSLHKKFSLDYTVSYTQHLLMRAFMIVDRRGKPALLDYRVHVYWERRIAEAVMERRELDAFGYRVVAVDIEQTAIKIVRKERV